MTNTPAGPTSSRKRLVAIALGSTIIFGIVASFSIGQVLIIQNTQDWLERLVAIVICPAFSILVIVFLKPVIILLFGWFVNVDTVEAVTNATIYFIAWISGVLLVAVSLYKIIL